MGERFTPQSREEYTAQRNRVHPLERLRGQIRVTEEQVADYTKELEGTGVRNREFVKSIKGQLEFHLARMSEHCSALEELLVQEPLETGTKH